MLASCSAFNKDTLVKMNCQQSGDECQTVHVLSTKYDGKASYTEKTDEKTVVIEVDNTKIGFFDKLLGFAFSFKPDTIEVK